jgi:hypothetical protein
MTYVLQTFRACPISDGFRKARTVYRPEITYGTEKGLTPVSAIPEYRKIGNSLIHRTSAAAFSCLLLVPLLARAQEPPAVAPQMSAVELGSAPIIDGDVLGDEAWAGALPTSGFWQVRPDAGQQSTQETEIRIGFTDTALYIGVVAYDDDPDGIVVTDSRRDTHLHDSDAVFILIDGLFDRQNGYIFATNPVGMEYDGQVTKEGSGDGFGSGGGGFNLNWDGSWSVQSRIGDYGWSTEFEIPFRTLRYASAEEQTWGINFQRNIRRNNEVAYWAPLDLNRSLHRVSDAGTLIGVVPPPQRNLKVTPYVLGGAQRGVAPDGTELHGTETDSEFGIDIKYSITPSLTLDITSNTDFAQVEVDEQQLNLDRFNLFFPEKRPFFLENAGQFAVGNPSEVEMFFSRRIGISEDGGVIPVDGGVRLSGKMGDSTNVGLLYMRTEGIDGIAPGNEFQVARINQELPNHSSIGALYVGRTGDGTFETARPDDHNRTYAIDGRWGIGDQLMLQGWIAKTETPGYEDRDGAFGLGADYDSEKWSSNIAYTEVGEDFNPEVGFLERSSFRKLSGYLLRRIRPEDLWNLHELRPHISFSSYWDFDGFQETAMLHVDNHWEYNTGTELHTGFNLTREGVTEEFEIVDGVWVQPGTYDHAEIVLGYFTDQSQPFSYGIRTIIGGRFGGDVVHIRPEIRYRIGEKFQSSFSVVYNDFDLPVEDGEFTATLARLRLSYSFSPKMQLQTLIQYNDTSDKLGANIRFSWLQSANSGLYLVYNQVDERGTDGLPTGREFIVKYSHIFDVLD